MSGFRRVLNWFGGKVALFLLLAAAILIYSNARPLFGEAHQLRQIVRELNDGREALASYAIGQVDATNAAIVSAQGWPEAKLARRIAAAERERNALQDACGTDLTALMTGGTGAIIGNRRRCIQAALLTRELDALAAVRSTLDSRRSGESISQAINRHNRTMRQAEAVRADALTRVGVIDERFLGRIRFAEERKRLLVRTEEAVLLRNQAQRQQRQLRQAQGAVAGAADRARIAVSEAEAAYQRLAVGEAEKLEGNPIEQGRRWTQSHGVTGALKAAAIALVSITAAPYVIRLILYFILAPLAARRPSIRLRVPGGAGTMILPAKPSAASATMHLAPGEELLVRQGYLQATSGAGPKSTRWLLNIHHPFSSIASGLTFLTRVTGDGELATVSSLADPFSEVSVISLLQGTACVLHPRALAGVAHPIGRTLQITSHWRLLSLNAWLTMRLRYLVFHRPARLFVKGTRGVRVEPAVQGRTLGQDQLIGFSADLAYSVVQAETFWPYFLGREGLLKDRVEAGEGTLIVEEAPLAGRKGGRTRQGLEGTMDAALKIIGL